MNQIHLVSNYKIIKNISDDKEEDDDDEYNIMEDDSVLI